MTDLPSLYRRARIILWVEDVQTRQYLDTIWRTGDIAYLIGGSADTIRGVTEDAVRSAFTHVFGLCDRDFGRSNRSRWSRMADVERVYRLDAHEVENLLLDASAIAGCRFNTAGRSEAEIEAFLLGEARAMCWWMATRHAVSELQTIATRAFPGHPTRPRARDRASARRHILDSGWVRTTAPDLPTEITEPAIDARLDAAYTACRDDLKSGAWRRSFSGKELFTAVDAFVFTRGRIKGSRMILARAIADQQRASGSVDPMLGELRDALLARVADGVTRPE